MRSLLVFFLSSALFFGASSVSQAAEKALFVSVLETPPPLESKANVDSLIERAKEGGYKTLFVQVYRANKFLIKMDGGTDTFGYLIRRAHAQGLRVHAWFNLLSLSASDKAPILAAYGPGILTRNSEKKTKLEDFKIDKQFFLEPGDPRVSGYLAGVVGKIAEDYPDLDGIQLDYIRYPDVKPAYGHTATNLARFKRATGKSRPIESDPEWRKWKRGQVTALVKKLRETALAANPSLIFSTTGLMTYTRAREESFQDWKEWVETGLADFVTLMAYTDDAKEYEKFIADAKRRLPGLEKVNLAIAGYKLKGRPLDVQKQWELCQASGVKACVMLDI
jgi:uncharacterized lipoprotein YddW (UPF0748 family)